MQHFAPRKIGIMSHTRFIPEPPKKTLWLLDGVGNMRLAETDADAVAVYYCDPDTGTNSTFEPLPDNILVDQDGIPIWMQSDRVRTGATHTGVMRHRPKQIACDPESAGWWQELYPSAFQILPSWLFDEFLGDPHHD